MTSWILPEKEKPPSVDSDFSCIVLTVYKLTRNDFHSNTADVVHLLHPQHLIFRKRGLPLRPLFRKAILPAEKTLLLPADQCQQDNCSVCRWLADWCNAPCGGFSDTDGAVVPICRYALRFPPAISGKADNSRLVTHTKSRSSFLIFSAIITLSSLISSSFCRVFDFLQVIHGTDLCGRKFRQTPSSSDGNNNVF